MAQQFVASGYDVKFMICAITGSTAYQRSSQQTHVSQQDRSDFARIKARGMTPEQLFDSLSLVTGCDESHRGRFLVEFSYLDRPTEMQTSILQALSMMNGRLTASATTLSEGGTLTAVAEAPFFNDSAKVETLFLATLSRPPTDSELARFNAYLSGANSSPSGLEDIFWVLLNSAEFLLNH